MTHETAQTREALVEVMLTAMSEHHSGNFAEAAFIVEAQLAALEAAGVRLVPVEATEEMLLNAGATPDGVSPRGGTDYLGKMLPKYYAAMLSASPYAKDAP